MRKFVPREKLGKRARRAIDRKQRATWAFSPTTRRAESKKLYNRKRRSHDRSDDFGMGFFMSTVEEIPRACYNNQVTGSQDGRGGHIDNQTIFAKLRGPSANRL